MTFPELDFIQWLVVLLLGALFFKEEMKAFIMRRLGKEVGEDKVDRLASYYNHSLTDQLNRIERAEEKEHEANERMREIVFSVEALLKEFKEYGIKLRQ